MPDPLRRAFGVCLSVTVLFALLANPALSAARLAGRKKLRFEAENMHSINHEGMTERAVSDIFAPWVPQAIPAILVSVAITSENTSL